MKKFLKVIGVVFAALLLLGWLLPDPKKGTTGAAHAEPTASTATAEAPAEVSKPDLEVLKSSESANEIARTIHVKVRNNTNHLISYADLKGVYYDKKGGIVARAWAKRLTSPPGPPRPSTSCRWVLKMLTATK